MSASPPILTVPPPRCVLDNGERPWTRQGLRQPCHIAFPPRRGSPSKNRTAGYREVRHRQAPPTFCANKLTYICKAPDGGYSPSDDGQRRHRPSPPSGQQNTATISDLQLNLYEVDQAEVERALTNIDNGAIGSDLIREGRAASGRCTWAEDEFGVSPRRELERPVVGNMDAGGAAVLTSSQPGASLRWASCGECLKWRCRSEARWRSA